MPRLLARTTQGDDFRVRGGIGIRDDAIVSASEDEAVAYHHGSHRHFPHRLREPCLGESLAQKSFILNIQIHLHPAGL